MTTVVELFDDQWIEEGDELAELVSESLSPRGPEMLFDLFAQGSVRPGELVLDLGARDAAHAIELIRRFGLRILMVDPIPQRLAKAVSQIEEAGLAGRVITDIGEVERLPMASGTVDQIWCRDILGHTDLIRGLTECARVLPTGATMLVTQTFGTELLEFNEARRLFRAMALNSESMSPDNFEIAARRTGFEVMAKEVVDSEWRERAAESGDGRLERDLLAIARLRRSREALIRHYGAGRFEAMYASHLWSIYQMLGKLQTIAYLLRRI